MQFQCQGPALPHIAAETAFNGRQPERARAAVARAINAEPEEVMLNECCAVGINYVAQVRSSRSQVKLIQTHLNVSHIFC